MSRYVSFAVLLTVIAFLTIVFFKILSGFLIPLFLAALLVVIFGPLHDWMVDFCKGRKKVAALLTTLSVLLAVLIPIGMLLTLAAFEGKDAIAKFNVERIKDEVRDLRTNVGLDFPIANEIREIEDTFAQMRKNWSHLEYHQELWYLFKEDADSIAQKFDLLPDPQEEDKQTSIDPTQVRQRGLWNSMVAKRKEAEKLANKIKLMPADDVEKDEVLPNDDVNDEELADDSKQMPPKDDSKDENGGEETVTRSQQLSKYHKLINETSAIFIELKNDLADGRPWANLKMLVNPDEEQLSAYSRNVVDFFEGRLLSFGGATTAYVGKIIFGCAIMIIALYFFLLDGPNMIESCQGLSPLNDEHEKELVSEFSRVSRAVVVATLLSALVQGLLAGIGFYFCGFESIFLLTMLTTALALVPFVGAASVWVPACLYLYFIQNDMVSAIGLAVYGAAIISMADNVIKPLVLHGQSNLHPLVALLSVLGGVSALGPVGLLVGPMVVAFLQTLLKILQRELTSMEGQGV